MTEQRNYALQDLVEDESDTKIDTKILEILKCAKVTTITEQIKVNLADCTYGDFLKLNKDELKSDIGFNGNLAENICHAIDQVNENKRNKRNLLKSDKRKVQSAIIKKIDYINKILENLKYKPAQVGSISIDCCGKSSYSSFYIFHSETTNLITHVDQVMELNKEHKQIKFEFGRLKNLAEEVVIEKDEQHPLFEKIIKRLDLKKDTFEMRHEQTLDSDRRPDFIFIKKTTPRKINLLYASFVVELLVDQNILDKEHLGKLIFYNEEVLNCNPTRQFIISVLTNLHDIVLIKSQSDPKNHNLISHKICNPINFWAEGVKYIKQLHDMPNTAGYDENSNFSIKIIHKASNQVVKYQLHKFLGKGLTARVYSLITCDEKMEECKDMVVKIFTNKIYFDNEQKIMDTLSENSHKDRNGVNSVKLKMLDDETVMYKLDNLSDKIIQRVAANPKKLSIIYTPRGKPLQRPITLKQFEQMIACMRELVNRGVIHRDITPHHFLSTKTSSDEKIFLIDFSSATFIQNGDMLNNSNLDDQSKATNRDYNYRGSVRFAANEILDCIIQEKKYTPHQRHDMESFVKMFYVLNMGDYDSFGYEADDITRIRSTSKYWKRFEKKAHTYWIEALKITRDSLTPADMLNKLFEHFKDFNMFKFDDDETDKK